MERCVIEFERNDSIHDSKKKKIMVYSLLILDS